MISIRRSMMGSSCRRADFAWVQFGSGLIVNEIAIHQARLDGATGKSRHSG
jgi:hypothetical protein